MAQLIGIFLFFIVVFSQAKERILQGVAAQRVITHAQLIRYTDDSPLPNYVLFRPTFQLNLQQFLSWFQRRFHLNDATTFELLSIEHDELGFTHYRYRQYYKGYPIAYTMLIVHVKQGIVHSFNGFYIPTQGLEEEIRVSEQQIKQKALQWITKRQGHPPKFLTPLQQILTWAPHSLNKITADNYTFAYRVEFHTYDPIDRKALFYATSSGKLLYVEDLIMEVDSPGIAVTQYAGTQPIIADFTGTIFRLRESGRGNGIWTLNLMGGFDPTSAVDFVDNDNFWNNVNPQKDEYAPDAHRAAEFYYDFLLDTFGRNSIDGNGYLMRCYVHWGSNINNAMWDGTATYYGDGNGTPPWVVPDIVGHEFTHGLTDFTADLIYQNESGALNESFSDIFGATLDWFYRPTQADWLVGNELGFVIRNMADPKQLGDPDTYLGQNWYTGSFDNGGVHINSGVQNYWFVLLSDGGSGVNDNGDSYNVTGIGIHKAIRIAYRNLVVYLFPSADYYDARFYAIRAAMDLYGPCSQEHISTTNAWYAVGVGAAYTPGVQADFYAPITQNCSAPFTVQFVNTSSNGYTFFWDFGDGNTDTNISPTHTYSAPGTYTVTLIADGGVCGKDTIQKVNYIQIDPSLICISAIDDSMQFTTCNGILTDDGGPTNNYSDNSNIVTTIYIQQANQIQLTFTEFKFEAGYDYLYIYDGPSTTSPLIGFYTGSNLPNGGTITTNSNAVTIRQTSDDFINDAGFVMEWQCIITGLPPNANFKASPVVTCSGAIQFQDLTTQGASSWYWDFGDGTTSTQRNPFHIYQNSDTYTVTLVACNYYGCDTTTQTVIVAKPQKPTIFVPDSVCPGDTFYVIAPSSIGDTYWYDNWFGGNIIHIGDTLISVMNQNLQSFFARNVVSFPIKKVGPVDNTFGSGGYFNNNQRRLYFDVHNPCIIKSVKVYSQIAAYRTIEILDASGQSVDSRTVWIPAGVHRIPLDFDLNPGTDYQIKVSSDTVALYRNSSGANYPYTAQDLITITRSDATGSLAYQYYYFFYDWEVTQRPCQSSMNYKTVVAKDSAACVVQATLAEGLTPVRLYPNPASQQVYLEVPKGVYSQAILYDLQGRKLKQWDLSLQQALHILRLPDGLPQGLYLLRLQAKETTTALKFWIK